MVVVTSLFNYLVISSFPDNMFYHVWTWLLIYHDGFNNVVKSVSSSSHEQSVPTCMNKLAQCQQHCSNWPAQPCRSRRLFSHDKNVVTTLSNHQYCYNLLTRLFSYEDNVVTTFLNHQYCYNLLTRLFSHEDNVVTTYFKHQYCYNLLTRLFNREKNVVITFSKHQYCYNLLTRLSSHEDNVVTTFFNH